MINLSRRHLLQLGGAAAFASFIPATGHSAGARDPRFITIVLRGALDGLNAVPPVGDPDFMALRGDLMKKIDAPLPLHGPLTGAPDDFFGLHPSLPNLARQYGAGQALILHAAASSYRERSHFDGQDVLESGQPVPGRTDSGWMNRLLLTQTPAQKVKMESAVSVGTTTPLILRGQAPSLGWTPGNLGLADESLPGRLMALYEASDPQLAEICAAAMRTREIAGMGEGGDKAVNSPALPETMVAMAEGAARMMARDDGPRIAALAFEGWDTHTSEVAALKRQLNGLDRALAAFETTLGPVWSQTAILVITEFGRTVHVNGTAGTDHGTGTTAFLTGGAVRGGRVIADWPGLKQGQLYQGRDLNPTHDIRALAKGVMQPLFDLSDTTLANEIFPDSAEIKPMPGLIA